MKEAKIDSFMNKLHSRAEIDVSLIKDELNLFLSDQYSDIVHYMNNAFFVNENNVFLFLRSSINQGSKSDDDIRKLIYEFLSEYISQNTEHLIEYIAQFFKIIHGYFIFQHASRPKQFSLTPLITIIDSFEAKVLLSQKVLKPDEFHNNLVNLLKCQKFVPGVKGQIWLLISTIQGKFTTSIDVQRKRQVQKMCLYDLKNLINENKNFSTIASLLRSFKKSLEEIFLGDEEMKELYKIVSVLILPLSTRYEVSITALNLLSKRTGAFHLHILEYGRKLFQDLCGLLNHPNRQFILELNDTLDDVTKEIVQGIQQNPSKYEPLYQVVIKKSWDMLQSPANYEITGTQSSKQKYKYNIVTILKILGTLSPLVKQFQTSQELQKFFNTILRKCSKKIKKAFSTFDNLSRQEPRQQEEQSLNDRHKKHIKYILYNQKELISFISALSQIIYNINSLTEYEENQLIKIIMISIEQYPSFFEKYLQNLARVLVQIFKVLQIKCSSSFYHIFKRIISSGTKILLDSKKFNIENDDEYYIMIKKTIRLWGDLLNNQNWSASSLSTFGNILFQFFEAMIEHLDISYKSNLQIQMEEDAADFNDDESMGNMCSLNQKKQKEDIAKTFYMSSETMRMSNIEEFQYMHSIVLVFQGVLSSMKNFNYSPRIIEFYGKVVQRIRVFPKSVSLMKVIRALNSYLVKAVSTSRTQTEIKNLEGEYNDDQNIEVSQLNSYCSVAKKLYIETIQHYLQKHQQECLYECLKMLTSFPVEVYFFQNCLVLKNNFPRIIERCFQMGQEIISLANSAIDCLKRLFEASRPVAQKYLLSVIPKMERFIWLSGQGEEAHELQSSKKIYLFVDQFKVTKQLIAKKIMDFLGSIGGLAHLLVDNSSTNLITWDYQDAIEIDVLMGSYKCTLNLSKLLNRICFLALNGQFNIKRASCEFLHSIFTVVIGNAAQYKSSKQVTANFLDKVFPTILQISSNSSHPSQQLIHTILIQSIRFFALTQQPNSPDVSAILKHLLSLYNGTEDMSCLGSKCIAQLVRWHIKSDTRSKSEHKHYPIIKVIMRNIWTLASNKKAKDGLILLLVELLKQIHREEDLMKHNFLEICSIIINIGKSNEPIEKELNYLLDKLVLSLNRVIKKLIIDDKRQGDQYKRFPTIHKFLEFIYDSNFFSLYSQQREIAFILWKQIITKYSHILNYSCLDFLRNRADRNRLYLFAKIYRPLQKFSQKQLMNKLLSKMVAFCDIWKKMLEFSINSAQNLARFKDIEEIVIQSYVNFTYFLIFQFNELSEGERCLSEEVQKNLVLAIKSFPSLLNEFRQRNLSTGNWLQQRFHYLSMQMNNNKISLRNYMIFMIKIIIKPSIVVPNFDYDLFEDPQSFKNTALRKTSLSQSCGKQIPISQKSVSCDFSELMWDYLFHLSVDREESEGLLELLFLVIEKIYYCTEKKLIRFLFARKAENSHEVYGFSSSFIEQYENSRKTSYIYERQVRTILKSIVVLGRYHPKNYSKIVGLLSDMIKLLKQEGEEITHERKEIIISTIFQFASYDIVKKYFIDQLVENGAIYLKFEKKFNNFLLRNFSLFAEELFFLMRKQLNIVKLFYLLQTKLSPQDLLTLNELWTLRIPEALNINDKNENDCYRLNYFFAQTIPHIESKTQFLKYMEYLIKEGLDIKRTSEIHFLTINLASIVLKRLKKTLRESSYLSHDFKVSFDRALCPVSNFYIPFTLGQLKKQDEILNAQKYLKAIQNMIYLSDDFKYCIHLFVGFKDSNLTGKLKAIHESIIDSVVSKYYNQKEIDEQMVFAEWILSYFENQDYNNKYNIWNNFRLKIIEKFFVKIIHFTKKKVLIQLFHKYTPMLMAIISEKPSPKNIEDMATEFQIKQGAFIIIYHLYMYLPKPQKDKSQEQIHNQQYHKKIITKIVEVLKCRFDNSSMILMNEYDRTSPNDKKCLDIFRNYMCSAYNCLIVIFISTQSKVDHFKKYLFDKGEVLWEHLVDPIKVNYEFPIETQFEIMKPIEAISRFQFKKQKDLNKKIRDEYMQSSLYVIDQEAVPQSQKNDENGELYESEVQNQQVKESSIEKVLKLQIQEDYINKHPCMVNILRVIDYMYKEFYDGSTPTWMKSLYDQLISDDISLSVRILLTKVILNRSDIFCQATMWGQCLIKYLCLKQNGSQYIHYFYRDVLLNLIKYIKNGFKPKNEDINFIVMKLIRCLPHDKNMDIYSSNIDIMEEFMKLIPDIYVDKIVILKMLTSGAKKSSTDIKNKETEKNKFEWRMCGCIVMKSCLIFKIPILTEEEYKLGRQNNKYEKFGFFVECLKQKLFKLVEELIYETAKKYRVAAVGLYAQMARFFNQKDSSYVIADDDRLTFMQYIKQLINNIYNREQNRSTKQRLSLFLSHLVNRYPMALSDSKLFCILDTIVVKYKQEERYKLIEAALHYLNVLLNKDEKQFGYSVQFMQTLRGSIDKFITDNFQVYSITIKTIKQYAKPFFLQHREIFLAIYSIFDTLNKSYSNSEDESICVDYFEFIFALKDFLNSLSEQSMRLKPYLNEAFVDSYKTKIKESLIAGLGNQFNLVRKIILEHLQQSNNEKQSFEIRIVQLLKQVYTGKHENLWIINLIPLVFSIAKKSSNYNAFLFNKQIEQSAQFYDVDFKNISFHNSSQPYTPSYSFFTNNFQKPEKMSENSQSSFIASIGSNRMGGMIRATQNSYMSQEDQVFTILSSQSDMIPSMNSPSYDNRMMEIEKNQEDKGNPQEQRNYAKLNSIFMNVRRKNNFKQMKTDKPNVKFNSNVNVVGDKIRFKPVYRRGETSKAFSLRKPTQKNKKQSSKNNSKIHSSYRSYKVGQMPNVQISVAHVLEPLVQICCFDKEVSSQFFTVFLSEIISKNKNLQKNITNWFVQLLKNSQTSDFSFISTLQKCLITICQQGNEMIKLNINEIAIKSNTIDYAIVFTQQNLIKYKKLEYGKQKLKVLIQDEDTKNFVKTQWSDLIDLYQKISGHSFLQPMLKHITKQGEYDCLLKILEFKKNGMISDCHKELEELMQSTDNSRLHNFLEKQKLDCMALLGQWEPVSDSLQSKIAKKSLSNEQKRLLTLSLLNVQKNNKEEILQKISFPDDRFDYQKALIQLMKGNTDLADYHSGKQIENFYKYFKKTTSFDYNSKHLLLENIQKVYQTREFIAIYKSKEPFRVDILSLMDRWAKRHANEMFDSNMTWIELLESRILYTKMLDNRFVIPKQKVAKANTDYMIQVINQMLRKNIYGCAEVITKKALVQMKLSGLFNWAFYEALSDLKLSEYKKKVIINPKNYEMVPKVLLKELTQNKKTDYYSDLKYLSIENDHMEGFLQSCTKAMMCEVKPSIQDMIDKINKTYINYQKIKRSLKTLQKQNIKEVQVDKIQMEKLECQIHFRFSLFLQKILELTKGRYKVKEVADMMQKSNLPHERLTQNFVSELIETISLMNLNGSRHREKSLSQYKSNKEISSVSSNFKEKELNEHKIFSMILKLLKTIQTQKNRVGRIFAEAINDKKLPIWIFVYFIPQIIKTLNSHQLAEYFTDLFDSIMTMYPEALIYHFNCYYEKQVQCLTDVAKQVYEELHKKLDVHFKFIEGLELLYHPEKRLKQILQGFSRPGEEQNTIEELEAFIKIDDKRLGKYNKKFIEQHKTFIRKVINLKKEKRSESAAASEIQRLIKMLDPKNKDSYQVRDYNKLSDASLFFEDYNSNDWNRIEVPATIYCKFEEPLSWNKVFIESFDMSILTLKSQRKPKRITLYGSNQKKYMFLVKGGEDVRLDQRIQQLFNIMNKVLRNDAQCAKKKLQIKRFEVIPIKKMLGIFEWIDQTQTLKDVLQKELRKVHQNYNFADMNPAFKEYTQKVRNSSRVVGRQNAQLYKQFLNLSENQIVSNLRNCQSYIPFGLLRKTLLRLSKSYDFYLHIKNQFLSNYAVVCIIGYILGIGDRHLQNFLIHGPSASVILIDFGYSFGSSRDLAVPELIPFRLTKCFMEIMEPIGYQGIYKESMINAFSALQDSKNVIIDFCDVFIDDPLMQWIWKCKKQNPSISMVSQNLSMTISQEPPQKKMYSKRIDYVQKKLIGQHPRKILVEELHDSKHRQAKFFDEFKKAIWKGSKTDAMKRKDLLSPNQITEELITLASDKNILGRCYIGLNPFV